MYNSVKPYNKKIIELIQKTQNTPYLIMERGLIWKKFVYPEFHHVDGIGRKGEYHWQKKSFKNAVLDALAMNLNDLLCARAIPYALTDHIFLPRDDEAVILDIVGNLAEECQKRNIAITGGETAIHNNIKGLEISIAMHGFIKDVMQNKFLCGDVLIGIASSGLHSNGFTKIRELFKKEFRPEFLEPTFIYGDNIFPLLEQYDIHGMAHITGGAFTKLKDLLGSNLDAILEEHILNPQPIFYEVYERGVPDEKMYKIFNCGTGFIIGVAERQAEELLGKIRQRFRADRVGVVEKGNGKVKIPSAFSLKTVEF